MKAQMSLFDYMSVVLFAGGGGSDTGISCMTGRPVDLAVNHSIDAIRMHMTNHPYTRHLQEDVFAVEPETVCEGREVGILWASPDCTHFSKAKGGKPVKKEIRGLSWVVLKWALAVQPRVMFMENVEEIQTWGPCIETADGLQPDPSRKSETYKGFIAMLTTGIEHGHPALLEACEFLHISPSGPEADQLVKGLGYDFGSHILCAADYGVPTIRKRWFAVFRCDGQPVKFPEPTYARDGKNGLNPWRSAAEIIDWSIPCPSIFESKAQIKAQYGVDAVRPLADNTQKRAIRGVDKFTLKSANPFIVECNHGGDGHTRPISKPLNTLTGKYTGGVCAPQIAPITIPNTCNSVGSSVKEPVYTVTSAGNQLLVTPSLMAIGQTGGGDRIRGTDEPINTQVSKAETCLITPSLINYKFENEPEDVGKPLSTITSVGAHELIAPSLIQYHQEQSEKMRGQDLTGPIMTVDGSNRYGFVSAQLTEYFGNGQPLNVEEPMHTVTGRDREALTLAQISEFRGVDIGSSATGPLRAVASHDHEALNLAHVQKYYDGGYTGCGSDVEDPAGTITAHDHNALCLSHVIKFKGDNLGQTPHDPLQTITSESGGGSYGAVYTTVEHYTSGADLKHWPEIRALLNQHCGYTLADDQVVLLWINGTAYYIADIGLRMLTPRELYNAMGFPPDYIIDHDYTGRAYSKSAQVARCGNAVCPPVAGALVKANLAEYALPTYIVTLADLWKAVAV